MLIRFTFENFLSFKEKQELTLVASPLTELKDSLLGGNGSEYHLLPSAGIYGANASGKTNVLKALRFVSTAVMRSYRNWEPEGGIDRPAFLLDDESRNNPSSFEIEFIVAEVRYRYGFVLDSYRILEEWLYAYPSGKQQTWFTRAEVPSRRFTFSRNLSGENRAIENLTRKNSLFLSTAAQNNHQLILPVYNFLARGMKFLMNRQGLPGTTLRLCEDESHKDLLLKLLTSADLGITGLRLDRAIVEEQMTEPVRKFVLDFENLLKEHVTKGEAFDIKKVTKPLFLHRSQSGASAELAEEYESAGTMAYFWLLGPIVRAIDSGGVLCVDELDSSLHPLLAINVLRLFSDRGRNPRGAQLLFTTHNTNLLSSSALRRDQVWFTEKDPEGASHLYPLSDIRPRKNENLARGYLQGRYGAIPFLESDAALLSKGD